MKNIIDPDFEGPMPNLCQLQFRCPCLPGIEGKGIDGCVYGIPQDGPNPDYCAYDTYRCGHCRSTVARVNQCVLFLKAHGIHIKTEYRDMNELVQKVVDWGEAKGILAHATKEAQAAKMIEEASETLFAVITRDLDGVVDGIGDTAVTLILLARLHGLSLRQCLTEAYETIKDREGEMKNGTFIKSAD